MTFYNQVTFLFFFLYISLLFFCFLSILQVQQDLEGALPLIHADVARATWRGVALVRWQRRLEAQTNLGLF